MPDEPPFHKTATGREFFDRGIPAIIRELRRLNENLEKVIKKYETPEVKPDAPR